MVIGMKKASKQDILNNINIIDIAGEFSIKTESVLSGNFTHRCRCPSKDHKHGLERTGSLYIDSLHNNFYCFGCSASSNVIDFYMLCKSLSFSEAIKELGVRIDPSLISKKRFVYSKNNFSVLIEISRLVRSHLVKNPDDIKWSDGFCKKIDFYCEKIGTDDISSARKLLGSVKKYLSDRDGIVKKEVR